MERSRSEETQMDQRRTFGARHTDSMGMVYPAGQATTPPTGTGKPPATGGGVDLSGLMGLLTGTVAGGWQTAQTALNNASQERIAELTSETAQAIARIQATNPSSQTQAQQQAAQLQTLQTLMAAMQTRQSQPPAQAGWSNTEMALAAVAVAALGFGAYQLSKGSNSGSSTGRARRNPVVLDLVTHQRHFVPARKWKKANKKHQRALPRYEGR